MSGNGASPRPAVVEVERLTKSFPLAAETVEALRGVTLALHAGELVALVGSSGSGKSTLLNLLGCLDHPTGGTIRLLGSEVQALGERELSRVRRDRIGFVFQEASLIPTLTAIENVGLPLAFGGSSAASSETPVALLEQVGLAGKATRYPSQLSGGERQRVAVARALIRHPALLLADEPTGNLDSENGRMIFGLFQDLARTRGICVLVATHNEELAKVASRTIHLHDGRVVNGVAP